MLEELQTIISRAKQEISDARDKMVTHHHHSGDNGWAVIALEEYDSLIDEYETTINSLKEIGIGLWDKRDDVLGEFEQLFDTYFVPDEELTKDRVKLKKEICALVLKFNLRIEKEGDNS